MDEKLISNVYVKKGKLLGTVIWKESAPPFKTFAKLWLKTVYLVDVYRVQ